jgi:antitoxin YefM
MSTLADVQYISDADGKPTGVLVPIELWREIAAERETAYLLQSDAMKRRLLEAMDRSTGVTTYDTQRNDVQEAPPTRVA